MRSAAALTWQSAEQTCRETPGFHLAKFENVHQHNNVTAYLKSSRQVQQAAVHELQTLTLNRDFALKFTKLLFVDFSAPSELWFGLRGDTASSDSYTWADGSPLTWARTFRTSPWPSFDPNEPSGSLSCVRLLLYNGNYVWADRPCTQSYRFLCAKPHDPGLVNNSMLSLHSDSSNSTHLIDRDTSQCYPLQYGPLKYNRNQVISLSMLPPSADSELFVNLYFSSQVSCSTRLVFARRRSCSGSVGLSPCVHALDYSDPSLNLCSVRCPIYVLSDNRVQIEIVSDVEFQSENIHLCELETFYR